MRRLSLIFSGTACAAALLLTGCSGRSNSSASDAATNTDKVLNVYLWSDYIAPDTVANFEKETGIKVHVDTYDSNEVLETKLLTGHTAYDVVTPTGTFFERQIKAGVYRKLDKSALPNLVNADPDIMRRLAGHDPGNQYAIPYMWTTTGLGYDARKVHARLGATLPTGWSLLLDPANAAKLKDCGIALIDAPTELFQSVIISMGRDPNRFDPADVSAASEILRKIRPYIRYIDTAQYMNDLANGGICFAFGWSGDIERAKNRAAEAKNGIDIAYLIPREGALLTVDMVGIPADAPHPQNAERWLDYLMRPDVTAAITNVINYPNGNLASLPLVRADIKSDPDVYPDTATRTRLITPTAVPPEYSRLVTREWTRFSTGY